MVTDDRPAITVSTAPAGTPPSTPHISVIICTRNRPQDVATCLPSVLACDYPNFDVLIVDQSTDEATGRTVDSLQSDYPPVHYQRTTTVGKTRALNIALREATGELFAFTDDDCETPVGWLRSIADAFAADPQADILFGPVARSPALDGMVDICVPAWTFSEARPVGPNEICGMGANMAFRRSLLDRLPEGGLYDPHMGPGTPFPAGEEGDMVYRMRKQGAYAVLRPAMQLYHRAYRTPENWTGILYGYGVGDAAFLGKHTRCGDLRAAGILMHRLASNIILTTGRMLFRRPHDWAYVRGFFAGLRKSLRLPIDRQTRLYREVA